MKSIYFTMVAVYVLILVACSLDIRRAAASGGVRTVALSGMPAPGIDEFFGDVGYMGVSLNNRGETAFIASPSFSEYEFVFEPRATTSINDESVWTEAGGSGLRRIAREGPSLLGDGTFAQVALPVISDTNNTLYLGSFEVAPNPLSLWRNSLDQPDTAVVERGSIAPSTNASFSNLAGISVNALGNTAVVAHLGPEADVSNFEGIWAELGGGALDLVARQRDIAPGTDGKLYNRFQELDIGLGGHVAFLATIRGADINSLNDEAIWIAGPTGELSAAVREGSNAPGTSGSLRLLGVPSINRDGDFAFRSGLSSSPFGGKAIWQYSANAGSILIALQGDQAPGVDAVFASNHINIPTFRDPVLGDGGHITFGAELLHDDKRNTSIWLADSSGVLELVAQVGDHAPGTDDFFADLGSPTVNSRGQVAFSGRRIDFTSSHYGIWAQDKDGDLQPIALAGDMFDVSDDPAATDLRTIEYLSFRERGSFGSAGVTGFNDRGQVAFFARFTDGTSGVFVSDAVAVPEPSNLGLFALLVLIRRRRIR